MNRLTVLMCHCSLLLILLSNNPVWTKSLNDPSLSPANELEERSLSSIVGNYSDKGLIDILDQIINLGSVPRCATGQGQPGRCTVGGCPNLGNFTSVGCKGKNRFIKCCPNDMAMERYPLQLPGSYIILYYFIGRGGQLSLLLFGSYLECGIKPDRVGDLIVGGDEATPHSWPWATALYRVRNSQKFFVCGATIINRQYILTAAHCVYRSTEVTMATDYLVKVGAHDLSKSGEFMELEDIIIHENYTPQYHNDDIALLRLKRPLDFNKNNRIAPVCLPERDSNIGRVVGTMATMIGWGVHDQMDFSPSDTLYQVQVPIYNLQQCRKVYTDLLSSNYFFDWNNVICAAYKEGGKDTCQGDSGGPMLMPQPNGRYYQVGVVSFGYGCAEKGYPGVYTYVPHYLNWIGAHMHNY